MSAVHWSLPGQIAVGAAGLVMGVSGLVLLANIPHPLFLAIKTAQGRLSGGHVSFPNKPVQSDEDFARFLNKTRSKAALLWTAIALGCLIAGFSFLRGAYLLSKAVYLKAAPPSPVSILAHIAFVCLGLAIAIGSACLNGLVAGNVEDQERESLQPTSD